MSLLSLTYILCLGKSLQKFWSGLGESLDLFDLQLRACLLFIHDEEKVHDWESLHIFCVSQCVKR